MRLKPEIRAIVDWAEQLGWTIDPKQRSSGHYLMRHTSGATVTIPNTPSDYRALDNIRAQIRRSSDAEDQSHRSPKYRHERRHRDVFDMDAAIRERDARLSQALSEHTEALEDLRAAYDAMVGQLSTLDPRRDQRRIRLIARAAAALKHRM
jgi:hypothetical protein